MARVERYYARYACGFFRARGHPERPDHCGDRAADGNIIRGPVARLQRLLQRDDSARIYVTSLGQRCLRHRRPDIGLS